MFNERSRYHTAKPYAVKDRRGRQVHVVPAPPQRAEVLKGYHQLQEGQRPDQLAARYLKEPTAFWRIANLNDTVLPEALSEQPEIAIPEK